MAAFSRISKTVDNRQIRATVEPIENENSTTGIFPFVFFFALRFVVGAAVDTSRSWTLKRAGEFRGGDMALSFSRSLSLCVSAAGSVALSGKFSSFRMNQAKQKSRAERIAI